MSLIRWIGSSTGLILIATGCSSTSSHVVSPTIEKTPGINIVRTADGNRVDSISVRRDATRINDLDVRSCMQQQIVPASNEPATDILQPDASTWQRPGELQVNGYGAIHYRLSLQRLKDQNYYLFDQLGQTQRDGEGRLTWAPVPAWDHHQPKALHDALLERVTALQGCLVHAEQQQQSPSSVHDARVRSS